MNSLSALFVRRFRGIRVVDLAGAACLAMIVLVVYWSKAAAGAESARISDTTRQIAAEEQKVRLLRAQQAYLAQPDRLRRLSVQYLGLGPVKPMHEATPETLAPVVAPAAAAAPVTAPAVAQ